jgi:hypothetical protein
LGFVVWQRTRSSACRALHCGDGGFVVPWPAGRLVRNAGDVSQRGAPRGSVDREGFPRGRMAHNEVHFGPACACARPGSRETAPRSPTLGRAERASRFGGERFPCASSWGSPGEQRACRPRKRSRQATDSPAEQRLEVEPTLGMVNGKGAVARGDARDAAGGGERSGGWSTSEELLEFGRHAGPESETW